MVCTITSVSGLCISFGQRGNYRSRENGRPAMPGTVDSGGPGAGAGFDLAADISIASWSIAGAGVLAFFGFLLPLFLSVDFVSVVWVSFLPAFAPFTFLVAAFASR